jgi:hypothetical protein
MEDDLNSFEIERRPQDFLNEWKMKMEDDLIFLKMKDNLFFFKSMTTSIFLSMYNKLKENI